EIPKPEKVVMRNTRGRRNRPYNSSLFYTPITAPRKALSEKEQKIYELAKTKIINTPVRRTDLVKYVDSKFRNSPSGMTCSPVISILIDKGWLKIVEASKEEKLPASITAAQPLSRVEQFQKRQARHNSDA